MGNTVQSMTVVLSGYGTLHRGMVGGNPPCPAAIYVSIVDFTRYRAELQELFYNFTKKLPPVCTDGSFCIRVPSSLSS